MLVHLILGNLKICGCKAVLTHALRCVKAIMCADKMDTIAMNPGLQDALMNTHVRVEL